MPTLQVVMTLLQILFQKCDCKSDLPSRLTLSKTTVTLSPKVFESGDSLTVTCEPPASGVEKLHSLQLQKRPFKNFSSNPEVLVNAGDQMTNGKAQLKTRGDGLSASGSLDASQITLTISKPSCSAAGTYICYAVFSPRQGARSSATSSANLTVEVRPGKLSLKAVPHNKSLWLVNETLDMQCTGPVGTLNTSDQNVWVWQYSSDHQSSWPDYDGPPSDIQLDQNIEKQCYSEQTSTLRRTLQLNDTGRVYRCAVRWDGRLYEEHAATHSVGTVTLDGRCPISDGVSGSAPTLTDTIDASKADLGNMSTSKGGVRKANFGIASAAVIGSLFIIFSIVITVYLIVVRPMRQIKKSENGSVDHGEKTASNRREEQSSGTTQKKLANNAPVQSSHSGHTTDEDTTAPQPDDSTQPGDSSVPSDDPTSGSSSTSKGN